MTVLKKSFTSTKYSATFMVDEEHDGMRLDKYMQIHLASFSRQSVKKKIQSGDITIHNRPGTHRPSTVIHHRENITMVTHKTEHEDEYWKGEKLELDLIPKIVFEDDDFVVISKPPYMATHPTGKHLFNCATVFFESKTGRTAHSIHRLDRETSGILMLGKNPKTAKTMTDHFENDLVKKCYFFIAKVNEDFKGEDSFKAFERLGASEEGLRRVYINNFPEESTQGKHAQTFFEVLHHEGSYAFGLAFPQTGRQHQIRVHAMVHGLPLVGDKIYYGSFEMFQRFKDVIASDEDYDHMEISRHALHAVALRIPYKGKEETYRAPLPHDLVDWLEDKMTIKIEKVEQMIAKGVSSYFMASTK